MSTSFERQATVMWFDDGSGEVVFDDGRALPFDRAAFAAGGLRTLRVGQRVRVRTAEPPLDDHVVMLTLATLPAPDA